MPTPAGYDLSGLGDKIGPGGPYFRYALGALVGIGVIALGLVAFLFFPQIKNLFPSPTPTPNRLTNIPRPSIRPLAKGFQAWSFSYGDGATGPKIKKATVDTLNPPKGTTQTVTVELTNDSPITKVTAIVYTDNKSNTYEMNLFQGTNKDGTWTGVWKIDDSYDYTYHIDFSFESPTGNSDNALTFR